MVRAVIAVSPMDAKITPEEMVARRLYRETSGCLVLGRHRKALATLGRLFKTGAVGKTYWAIVEGGPAQDEGRIELALGRRDESRGWWMMPDPAGQPAVTTWKVLGRAQFIGANAAQEHGTASAAGVPSPACGGGLGRGQARTNPAAHPLPTPPPQAGEGADRVPGNASDSSRDQSSTTHITWLALEPLTGRTHQLR